MFAVRFLRRWRCSGETIGNGFVLGSSDERRSKQNLSPYTDASGCSAGTPTTLLTLLLGDWHGE